MDTKMRPNVVLIMADQWRGDCLGADGHPDVRTPFLDTLATGGVWFENAYSAVPSCIAARAAILTGMRQSHHGRVGYKDGVRWTFQNTLPGCFARAGYQTHCVGKMHVHPPRARLGFDSVELHDGFLGYYQSGAVPHHMNQRVMDDYIYELDGHGHKALTDTGLECNGWPARPWPYEETLHPTRWAGDRAVDFLRRRDRDCPFFLTVSFVRPHPPLDAPEAFFAPYRRMDLRTPFAGGDWEGPLGQTKYDGLFGIPDDTYARQAQEGYYACITQVDHQIGRLMQALRQDGCYANTVVMFISDHGEMLGDHNLFRKALPYEGSVRVPMLLSGPGIAQGCVSDAVMELRDVMPTLLDAASLPIPETVDGRSALSLLAGEPWREGLHGEHAFGELSNHYVVTSWDKYIWYSQTGREQYFNLVDDPNEMHDAIHDRSAQARVAALRQKLCEALEGREEGYVQDGKLVPGRPPVDVLTQTVPGGGE